MSATTTATNGDTGFHPATNLTSVPRIHVSQRKVVKGSPGRKRIVSNQGRFVQNGGVGSGVSRSYREGPIDGLRELNLEAHNRVENANLMESVRSSDNASSTGGGSSTSLHVKSPRSKTSGEIKTRSRATATTTRPRIPISSLWKRATIRTAVTAMRASTTRKRKGALKPDEKRKFNPHQITNILERFLENELNDYEYNPAMASAMTETLTTKIKELIKTLRYERYKLIAQVLIGSHNGQDVRCVSRCVWNPETDNFASVSYQNKSMFAVATVYGIYFE